MRDLMKKAILRLWPELEAGLHLPRYARVLRRPDAPEDGATCERFRPHYAVDLQILTPDLVVDPRYPVYEAVPVPIPAGGHEQGFFGLPAEGTLVTVAFAYGRQDHPIIQQVYPMGCQLPPVDEMEHTWAQSGAVFQKADKNGNWSRVTDQAIEDDSLVHITKAVDAIHKLTRKLTDVAEHSIEKIGGIKKITAMSGLKLLTAGEGRFSAGGNLTLTTASNFGEIVSRNRNSVTGQNETTMVKGDASQTVKGNKLETTGGDHTATITGKSTRTVGGNYSDTVSGSVTTSAGSTAKHSAGGTYTITAPSIVFTSGTGGVSLLQEILGYLEEIKGALDVLKIHTHNSPDGTTSAPIQSGQIGAHAAKVWGHRDRINTIAG